ncbi:MAG: DUF58 domain-containing protein [Bacteroidales bacterium]|nr:DUF58 domain-containing protein [Bacteroidales bacterium]
MMTLQEMMQQYSFGRLELLAKQVVEGFITGLHKSPYHGFSVEFVEHRLYNTGESKKHVDWKLYAKTDKLFVKKYEEETNLRCQIVIDTSSSMFFPDVENSKLRFSILAAASLIQLLRKQRDAYGLSLFSSEMEQHYSAKLSLAHHKQMMLELENLWQKKFEKGKRSVATSDILHDLAERIPNRSLVILFSDMFSNDEPEALFSALQHLKFKKHELILFHVTDHDKELMFNFQNKPYKFIDLETEEEIKLNPNQTKAYFTETMADFYGQLKLKCLQYKIDFVEVDIQKPFDELLSAFLLKRQRLY